MAGLDFHSRKILNQKFTNLYYKTLNSHERSELWHVRHNFKEMKTYKSNIFGDIPEPENFEELISLISKNHDKNISNVFMSRGQSNIECRVDQSAFRRLKLNSKKITEYDIIRYETSLLSQATHRGYRNQNGRIQNDFELLALLQHHGAATRLLDFTRNALIALWFCVTENIDKTGLLLGINSFSVGGYEGGEFSSLEDYEKQMASIKVHEHCQTWEPPIVTPRIAAQHSQFVYSRLSESKMGSIEFEYKLEKNVLIAINKELKQQFENILVSTFDLRFQTLFPDIDGFGDANSHSINVNSMHRW